MEYKPLILFFVLVLLFWWVSSEDKETTIPQIKQEKPLFKSGMKLKATATDGDNTVLVSTNDGEIKKASNIAKIDAVNTELTGTLKVTGNSLKIGNWTIEDQASDGNLVFYKGTKDTSSDKPYLQISGVDGNIYLNSSASGNPRGWLTTNLSGVMRKGTNYSIEATDRAHYLSVGGFWKVYAPGGLTRTNTDEKFRFNDFPV